MISENLHMTKKNIFLHTFQVLRSKLEMKERQNVTSNDTVHLKKSHKTKKKCC